MYLGAKDWYTMHYFSICSGFWAPSTNNPSLLTSTKINVLCTRQAADYTFSLSQILASELLPHGRNLLADVPTKSYSTSTWSSCWYSGITYCFIACILLPFAFSGKRRRINDKVFVLAQVWSLLSSHTCLSSNSHSLKLMTW